jgi:hypothetical protein
MMHIDELIGAIDNAEGPNATLDRLVAERLGKPWASYTGNFAAARSALPEGWGYTVDHYPGRVPYGEATGPKALGYVRIAATAATAELALLSAAMRAQKHLRSQAPIGTPHKEPAHGA